MRALAVSGNRQVAAWPEVPTAVELGYQGFDLHGWTGIVGSPGLPGSVVDDWDAAIRGLSCASGFAAEIEAMDAEPAYLGPLAFRDTLASEFDDALDTAMRLHLRR